MTERAKSEAGFTIVEVIVAAMILVIGALTTFGLLSAATKNTQRAKATQVALDRAQQEIEALRGISNEELALTAAPPSSADQLDPNYRVLNSTFAVKRRPRGEYKTLVVNGGSIYGEGGEGAVIEEGVVNPGPVHFTSGDVSGEVYRYVVWANDESCGGVCPGQQDYKQVIVAVKLDSPGNQAGERGYVEVQSDFVNPKDSAANDPEPNNEGNVVTAQQFYLTDTPCSSSGTTVHQEITGDHLLHNTLGTCANGLQTDTTQGAPDALLLGAPPDPAPEDPSVPALYDYSNDFYLEPTPDTDKGVQIRRDDTSGCNYVPTNTTHPEARIHRWVTDRMSSTFKLTGNVNIEFYTRALNDELYTGTVCVFLFRRHEEGSVATDTRLTNSNGGTAYWKYTPPSNNYWPQFKWERVRMTMKIRSTELPYSIPAGDRLGVALSVERSNTPADAIPIMYDHPLMPSRIEVDTSTPLEGG